MLGEEAPIPIPALPVRPLLGWARHVIRMSAPNTPSKAIDPFFELVHDGEWNACVGIQGNDVNYVDGYLEAARELVAAVLDKQMVASRDTLAMPILYNCRHALELALKFAVDRLHRTGVVGHTHVVNHDILSHWQHLRDAEIGDARIVELVAELEPFVVSLAGIDEDGQELRYSRNRDGAKSLADFAVVNLPLIRRSIEQLAKSLDQLKYRIFDLENERTTGTHTKECSRMDLEAIARALGGYATWHDANFVDRRRAVMDRFGLSSRKFSSAVNMIRKSRPLAALVGLDPKDLGLDYFDRDWGRFREHTRIALELAVAIEGLLSIEEFSDLETLFYIGRERVLGEHYQEMLVGTVAKLRAASSRRDGVHHIMSKRNLLDCVVDGAVAVGRPSLGSKIRDLRPS